MLAELRITGFAPIDHAELALGEGFNALTGATGVGKSLIIDALELLLGGATLAEGEIGPRDLRPGEGVVRPHREHPLEGEHRPGGPPAIEGRDAQQVVVAWVPGPLALLRREQLVRALRVACDEPPLGLIEQFPSSRSDPGHEEQQHDAEKQARPRAHCTHGTLHDAARVSHGSPNS